MLLVVLLTAFPIEWSNSKISQYPVRKSLVKALHFEEVIFSVIFSQKICFSAFRLPCQSCLKLLYCLQYGMLFTRNKRQTFSMLICSSYWPTLKNSLGSQRRQIDLNRQKISEFFPQGNFKCT